MTLYENLHFFAGLHGLDDNDALERSSFLLHKLEIWEGRDLPVEKLSTGVVRRASLARALMHSPKVLLVDDSACGLDQETAQATGSCSPMWPRRRASPCSCAAPICTLPQLLCRNIAILRQGVLLARGDLESLRTGAGVSYRACLCLGEGSPAPAGFHWNDGFWEREIESQEDMPKIISRAVGAGARLYEARLDRPTLKEIYAAWLEGGRRKVKESHGTADETPTDGSFWQPGEDEPAAHPGEEPPEPAPGQGAPEEGAGEEV